MSRSLYDVTSTSFTSPHLESKGPETALVKEGTLPKSPVIKLLEQLAAVQQNCSVFNSASPTGGPWPLLPRTEKFRSYQLVVKLNRRRQWMDCASKPVPIVEDVNGAATSQNHLAGSALRSQHLQQHREQGQAEARVGRAFVASLSLYPRTRIKRSESRNRLDALGWLQRI